MQATEDKVQISKAMITRLEAALGVGVQAVRRELPEIGAQQVEIAPQFSYISAGTELRVIQNFCDRSVNHMPQGGMGYSQSGIVCRVGEGVEGIVPGDRVVAIGAGAYHAQRTVVGKNLVVRLPETVSMPVASMMAMYCFALEGVRKEQPRIGENVVVAGAGMMGQVTARLYHLAGCRVCVVDTNTLRLEHLPREIERFEMGPGVWDKVKDWAGVYGVETASICFGGDATETLNSIKLLMSRAPDGVPHGKVIFPGGAKISVLMASNMGNIRLISSAKAGPGYRDAAYEAGDDYPVAYVPWTVRRNVEILLAMIADGRLTGLEKLITHRFPFAEAFKAYEFLRTPNVPAMAVLLDYGAAEI